MSNKPLTCIGLRCCVLPVAQSRQPLSIHATVKPLTRFLPHLDRCMHVMFNTDCQLDQIKIHLRDKPLGMSVGEALVWVH